MIPTAEIEPDESIYGYGPGFACWDKFRQTYTDTYKAPEPHILNSFSEKQYDIDSANVINAQRRFREKRAMDGWACKNAEYFKQFYSDELSAAESRPWFGRQDW